MANQMGWIRFEDRTREVNEATANVIASQAFPIFCATPNVGSLYGATPPDVMYWEYEEALLKRRIEGWAQTHTDCTSFALARAAQDLILVEVAERGDGEVWPGHEVATEPIYGGGRVEIGGRRIRGNGLVVSWGAKWLQEYGVLLRKDYRSVDLSTYSGSRAKSWGESGVPNEIEPIARENPVKDWTVIQSGPDIIAAAAGRFPIATGSNYGFTETRDENGFCYPSGSWAHAMAWRGYVIVKGNRPAVPIQQSWKNSPRGNDLVKLESGREIKLPFGVFLVDMEHCERMAARGDAVALTGVRGWEASGHKLY